jgi:hypothetical protein
MISVADAIRGVANPSLRNYIIDLEMGGHFMLNFAFKQPVVDYSKFLFDLDLKLSVAAMHDPSLVQDSLYRHHVFYHVAKEFHQNLREFQAYAQWGEELTQNQIDEYTGKISHLKEVIEEIEKEIRNEEDLDSFNSVRLRKLQALNELISEDFTPTTIEELESKKSQLEEEISEVQKEKFSNCVVLRSVKEHLTDQSNIYDQGATLLKIQRIYRSQIPVFQILQIMENTCFSEPAPEICLPNSTMSNDVTRRMEVSSLSESSMLTPMAIIAGFIGLVLLRLLFRPSVKQSQA